MERVVDPAVVSALLSLVACVSNKMYALGVSQVRIDTVCLCELRRRPRQSPARAQGSILAVSSLRAGLV